MIERFNNHNKLECSCIVDCINKHSNYDFYFTEDNSRIYISDEPSLKKLFKNTNNIFVLKERGEYKGIILVWKSIGGELTRYYVKLCCDTASTAEKLLTVLLWNINKELYIKLRKDSEYLEVFRKKGFKFKGGRGIQVLLSRKPKPLAPIKSYKDEN